MRRQADSLFTAVLCAAAIGAIAPSAVHAAPYFETGFESPGYTTGNLVGQDNWVTDSSTPDSGRQVVAGGVGGLPGAPDGSQMAMIASPSTNERAQRSFAVTPITDDFFADITLAHRGVVASGDGAYVYLNTPTSAFNGVIFGFNDGFLAYRSGNTWVPIDTDPNTGAVDQASADTFYRFVAKVRPSDAQYDLKVYDSGGVLIGDFENLYARNGLSEFSQIRLFSLNTDDVLFVDSISISPVPEPSSLGLIMTGIAIAIRRKR